MGCLLPTKAGSSISRAFVSAMDEYALLDRVCCVDLSRVFPHTPTAGMPGKGELLAFTPRDMRSVVAVRPCPHFHRETSG